MVDNKILDDAFFLQWPAMGYRLYRSIQNTAKDAWYSLSHIEKFNAPATAVLYRLIEVQLPQPQLTIIENLPPDSGGFYYFSRGLCGQCDGVIYRKNDRRRQQSQIGWTLHVDESYSRWVGKQTNFRVNAQLASQRGVGGINGSGACLISCTRRISRTYRLAVFW